MSDQAPPKFPSVQGRCPACRGDSLFIGSGGYVTCSRLDCPDPSAADELLHGGPVTAATPLVCSDERHTVKVAGLEQQLARLRAGEETGYDPLTVPTPGQWIARFNEATAAERLDVVKRIIAAGERANRCLAMAHESRLDEDRKAWVAVARVQDVIADMENITGARHWAGILRTAVDGAPTPPATEATEPAHTAPALRSLLRAAIEPTLLECPEHNRTDEHEYVLGEIITAVLAAILPATRTTAALARRSEADVQRVIALYEQWVKAGPPPLGTSLSRWWDARLVELHDAILPPADTTKEQ